MLSDCTCPIHLHCSLRGGWNEHAEPDKGLHNHQGCESVGRQAAQSAQLSQSEPKIEVAAKVLAARRPFCSSSATLRPLLKLGPHGRQTARRPCSRLHQRPCYCPRQAACNDRACNCQPTPAAQQLDGRSEHLAKYTFSAQDSRFCKPGKRSFPICQKGLRPTVRPLSQTLENGCLTHDG